MAAIDDVKQKTDIVDVIGQYVTLKKAGRNFKALCPFHNEKTPSFIVFPDQGTWHCFGACNTGGDAFTFLMKRENIDFGEALRRLAQRAGVELVSEKPGEDAERKRLRGMLSAAAAHFHYLLKSHSAAQGARDYLVRRHLTSDSVERFELGFALNEWQSLRDHLTSKGYTPRELEAAGLVIQGEHGATYDRFRGRLIFPIRNRTGEVVGFGARTLAGDEPKYLNSPQTSLFDKSSTLYGLDLAKDAIRGQNLAVIVEGYMDVIAAHQAGFTNVVASLGTALTEKQLALLKRLTKRYALALDPDAAGEQATLRGLQVAREALERKTVPVPIGPGLIGFEERLEAELLVIPLPPGQDPDQVIHSNPQSWQELVSRAEPLVEYSFRTLTQDLDLNSARDKSTAVKRLVPVIREIGDDVQRAHYIQELARLVKAPEQTIAVQVSGKKARREQKSTGNLGEADSGAGEKGSRREEYLMTLLLHVPKYLARVQFLEANDLSPTYRGLFLQLRETFKSSGSTDRASVRSRLDSTLQPEFDRLLALERDVAEFTDADLIREIETVAYRLQLERDRAELGRLEVSLRDSETALEDHRLLQERVAFLLKRIGQTQKALSTRTMFGPRQTARRG